MDAKRSMGRGPTKLFVRDVVHRDTLESAHSTSADVLLDAESAM
jgi:hypothetical protein